MIETVIGIYLFIGAMFLVKGPVAENITREIDRARGTPLSSAYLERELQTELKLFILWVVVIHRFCAFMAYLCMVSYQEAQIQQSYIRGIKLVKVVLLT